MKTYLPELLLSDSLIVISQCLDLLCGYSDDSFLLLDQQHLWMTV